MLRIVFFDLDGVLRRFPEDLARTAEESAELPAGSIARAAFKPDLLRLAITGAISDEEWRRRIGTGLCEEFPECAPRVEDAVASWSSSPGEPVPEVLDIVRRVRQRASVGVITNATSRLSHDLDRLGLLDELDLIINSSAVGVPKPAAEIYQAALGQASVEASETLFVDDHAGNVEAARALGMHGYVFGSAAGLTEMLQSYGLV